MPLSRKTARRLARAAQEQEDEWVRLMGDPDELWAVRVLHALANEANVRYSTTSGDVGVIAIQAVRLYDRYGSATRVNSELRAMYDSGDLLNLLGEPLNRLIRGGAVSGIGMSALLNARPDSEREISKLGPQP